MKKIVSLMLSVMILLSSITVVTADTSANGVNINRWNGFAGDGVTVSNPADLKPKSMPPTPAKKDAHFKFCFAIKNQFLLRWV